MIDPDTLVSAGIMIAIMILISVIWHWAVTRAK
jgi:hypothetical protein